MSTPLPPVILLGMHRSGTAMIARLLDQLGLFQGVELQEDHESTWFLEVNDLLLKRVNAAWDHPSPIRDFLANEKAFDLTARCLKLDLDSWQVKGYLGWAGVLKYGSLFRVDRPWAWKDPRTVFTLPLWLKLFPSAKLVYIIRNGVDVAASLRAREKHELDRRLKAMEMPAVGASTHLRIQRSGFKGSSRCLTLEGAFSLWEEYVAEAERLLSQFPNDRHIVSYEAFLNSPAEHLSPMARFCGLDCGDEQIRRATALVNAGRANAFLQDPDLERFYQTVRQTPWMQKYGYADLSKSSGAGG